MWGDEVKKVNDRMPYTYWRWWLAMMFLWPLVLLAMFLILTYKALILSGEMLIDAGEWIKNFNHPVCASAIEKLGNWMFKE